MKSKHLLLTLFLALLVPWAANAQETLTVCDGTNTNNYVPIYGLYCDEGVNCEYVIPAALLNDMDGGTITAMKLYLKTVSWNAGTITPSFTIFMKEVDNTTMTAFTGTTGATTVYNNTITITTSTSEDKEVEITFEDGYSYGGGNLLVGFYQNGTTGYKSTPWYGEDQTYNSAWSGYGTGSNANGNGKSFLPKTTFTYEPAAAGDCPKPKTLVISEVTAHTATATWTMDEPLEPTANGFNIEYKKASDPDEPLYWHRVGEGYDVYSTTFTNLAAETEYQARVQSACGQNVDSDWRYAQNFTTEVSCFPPTGYQIVEGSLTYNYVSFQWDYEEGEVFQYTMMHGHGLNPADANFNQGDWMAGESFPYWDNLFSDYDYTFFLRKKCDVDDFSAPVSIEFTTPEACPAPVLATPTNPTAHGVTLSWTGDYESYNVMYRQSLEVLNEDFNSLTTANSIPAKWDNSEGTTTSASYKWCYNTSSYGNGATNGTSHDGSKCVRFDSYNNGTNKTNFLKTPTMKFPAGVPMKLTFWWKNPAGGDFSVYISTDGGTTQTAIAEGLTGQSEWTQKTIELTDYVGASNVTIHFKGTSNYGYNDAYIYLDDVVVSPIDATPAEWLTAVENVSGNSYTLNDASIFNPESNYEVKVVATCTNVTPSTEVESNVESFTTDEACPAPTALAVTTKTAYTAVLDWEVNGTETEWVVTIKAPGDNGFLHEIGGIDAHPYTIGLPDYDLQPNTTYTWKVRAGGTECDPLEKWSNEITFTTEEACPTPTLNNPANITQNTADLSWEGSPDVSGYTVEYRTAEYVDGLSEEFATTSLPSGWGMYLGTLNSDGTANMTTGASSWSFGANHNVLDGNHAFVNIYGSSQKWLASPKFEVSVNNLEFDLALTAWNSSIMEPQTTGTDDRFVVLVKTGDIDLSQTVQWTVLRQWDNVEGSGNLVYNNIANTGEHVSIDLSAYMGQEVTIAFYGESTESNADNNMHIDNVMCGTFVPEGEWQTAVEALVSEDFTYQLTSLEPGTKYDVRVKADCSDPEAWSNTKTFTTLADNIKVFVGGNISSNDTEGNQWSNPYNWVPYGMPASDNGVFEDVIIRHNAVIGKGYQNNNNIIANANTITFEQGTNLTIEDGGQLKINNSTTATVKKNIPAWTENGNFRLITNPLNVVFAYPNNYGMLTESAYDFYSWNYTNWENDTDLEWINYNQSQGSNEHPFSFFSSGQGYLYANEADVTLSFTGDVIANKFPVMRSLNYDSDPAHDYHFNGWNLLGNNFVCNAYLYETIELTTPMSFFRMNEAGDEIIVGTGAIAPMEGFFVQATESNQTICLSRNAPSGNASALNINVNNRNSLTDRAIVRFDESRTLEKLQMNRNHSKVYIPMEGKDYAVVNAGQMGELPVNFKAETDGTYTMGFTNEEVEFSYLHLIDNLTGVETDLLANPSYSFEAKTTDYVSRFRLVFATGSSAQGNSFAFVRDGNLLVLGIDGTATLQVVDVTGRILSSETFSGSYDKQLNVAPGVYVIRLINGNDVKTQKIVVK